jgi:hypothetical protein
MPPRLVSQVTLLCSFLVALVVACQPLDQKTGSSSGGDGGTPEAGATPADAGKITGAGCGTEQKAGIELCIATSKCPNIVVDTQAMPSCGFRIHGSAVDLVCACGTAVCPMGVFATCAEAAQLLENQTESSVCVQVSEGRCTDASSTSSSSSSSSSGNPSNTICDKDCMKQCGGGAGCASVCNCD